MATDSGGRGNGRLAWGLRLLGMVLIAAMGGFALLRACHHDGGTGPSAGVAQVYESEGPPSAGLASRAPSSSANANASPSYPTGLPQGKALPAEAAQGNRNSAALYPNAGAPASNASVDSSGVRVVISRQNEEYADFDSLAADTQVKIYLLSYRELFAEGRQLEYGIYQLKLMPNPGGGWRLALVPDSERKQSAVIPLQEEEISSAGRAAPHSPLAEAEVKDHDVEILITVKNRRLRGRLTVR